MESLIKEHKEKFGVEPNIIGLNWDNPDAVVDGIADAIEEGKPYDEYKLLSKEEREAFDNGELVF